jgi:hypothetical protein
LIYLARTVKRTLDPIHPNIKRRNLELIDSIYNNMI